MHYTLSIKGDEDMIQIKHSQQLLQQEDTFAIVKDFKRLWKLRECYNRQTVSELKVKKLYLELVYRYEPALNYYKYHMIHLNYVVYDDQYVDRALRHLLMGLSEIIPETILE